MSWLKKTKSLGTHGLCLQSLTTDVNTYSIRLEICTKTDGNLIRVDMEHRIHYDSLTLCLEECHRQAVFHLVEFGLAQKIGFSSKLTALKGRPNPADMN